MGKRIGRRGRKIKDGRKVAVTENGQVNENEDRQNAQRNKVKLMKYERMNKSVNGEIKVATMEVRHGSEEKGGQRVQLLPRESPLPLPSPWQHHATVSLYEGSVLSSPEGQQTARGSA